MYVVLVVCWLAIARTALGEVWMSAFSRPYGRCGTYRACPVDGRSSNLGMVQAAPDTAAPDTESAKMLSDYMAKAHEDKLRAVQEVEKKKAGEIESLRKEVEQLKLGASAPANAVTLHGGVQGGDFDQASKEQLIAQIHNYQRFMSEYVVKVQEQKVAAVKQAEAAVAKKLQDKFLLGGSDVSPAPPAVAPAPAPPSSSGALAASTQGSKLYNDRSAKVAQAAAAGKSRWGAKEVQRASGAAVAARAPASATAAPTTKATAVDPATVAAVASSPEVVAADHGLRADGGVGGLTLAERVAMGAAASEAAKTEGFTVVVAPSLSLYDRRNLRLAAAAKAGLQSRWGTMEVDKATTLAAASSSLPNGASVNSLPAPAKVPPEVEAADHGLRADGAVGGPSLAERVNFGAQILAA